MSYFDTTYWAIRTTDGCLHCGPGDDGLYSTEKRAREYLNHCLDRQKTWIEKYRDTDYGQTAANDLVDMETWRVVTVKIVETTLDGETL